MKRTFIGIKVKAGKRLSSCYEEIQQGVKQGEIKMEKTENFHITLKFLGKTTGVQEYQVSELLSGLAARLYPFSFLLKGIGYFGRKKDPNVIWVGVEEGDNLKYLQKLIDRSLADFGFETEKNGFTPHLTIARIKGLTDVAAFHRTILPFKDSYFQEELVQGITFFESRLSQDGATYLPIAEFNINSH